MSNGPDFGSLSGLKTTKKGRSKTPWAPATPASFEAGNVLAFDQSLAATGWVWLACTGTGQLGIMDCDSYGTKQQENVKGIEEDFIRADELQGYALGVIHRICGKMSDPTALEIVHEFPSVNSKFSTISSTIAGYAIRQAAMSRGFKTRMIGAQPAKKLACGNANAKKPEAHRGLKAHYAPFIASYDHFITNEAKRDALMLALRALWKDG